MEKQEIYVQARETIIGVRGSKILLKDIVDILAEDSQEEMLKDIEILKSIDDRPVILISALEIIQKIKNAVPGVAVAYIGDRYIAVKVNPRDTEKEKKFLVAAKVIAVSIILFIGAGMAIMNFHSDVNMGEVHKEIYTMITGKTSEHPLVIQIPYSLGIGAGMAVFFNHFSKKKRNIEPSPLNVEMMSYDKGVYDYVIEKLKEQERCKD